MKGRSHPIGAAARSLCVAVILSLLLAACSFDKEEELFPLMNCDTTNVSYANDISPIISDNCLSCHSLSIATAGIVLEEYTDVQPLAVAGRLVRAVEFNNPPKQMPFGGPKLPDCSIAKIRSWVREGALDN